MKNSANARRQVNNELKTRSHNEHVKDVLAEHASTEMIRAMKVHFYCECSDDACTTRIPMTFEEYEKLHNSPARFVLAKGHQSPMVEKIVKKDVSRIVVEKYAL